MQAGWFQKSLSLYPFVTFAAADKLRLRNRSNIRPMVKLLLIDDDRKHSELLKN